MDARRTRLIELFQRAQAQVTDRVDAVEPGQWDAEALPGWTVADLVAHLVVGQRQVPALLGGGPVPDPDADTDRVLAGDPLGAWEAAADDALTAWALHEDLDGPVHAPTGAVPAGEHLAGLVTELTVHAWDLARATGADPRPDPELVAAGWAHAQLRPTGGGVPGQVAAAVDVAPDADPWVRLLAAYGRRA